MNILFTVRRADGAASSATIYRPTTPLTSIGSDQAAAIRLPPRPNVAAEQAVVITFEDEPPLFINRAPGTTLNGEALEREARRALADCDVIGVGDHVIECRFDCAVEDAPVTRTGFERAIDEWWTAEDCYCFVAENGDKLPMLGEGQVWSFARDEETQKFTLDAGSAENAARPSCAVVSKHWNGVTITPLVDGQTAVNGEVINASRELREGDRVTMNFRGGQPRDAAHAERFVFREPAALAFGDLLRPRDDGGDAAMVVRRATNRAPESRVEFAVQPTLDRPREYFGAFTLIELALTAGGTLLGGFVIFLLLGQ